MQRLDVYAQPIAVTVQSSTADTAKTALHPAPGRHYGASAGKTQVTLAVDPLTKTERNPLIGRIIFLNR